MNDGRNVRILGSQTHSGRTARRRTSAPVPARAASPRAAVWGSPITHSLSPLLHRAAYTDLDLERWSYSSREVEESTFEQALRGLDDSWQGLSLTMPLKEVALAAAQQGSDVARATGAANTLIRVDGEWHADNTDVHGLLAAVCGTVVLRPDGTGVEISDLTGHPLDVGECVILGAGATARSAIAMIGALGGRHVVVQSRRLPEVTASVAQRYGIALEHRPLGQWPQSPGLVISTLPSDAADVAALTLPRPAVDARLVDVIYAAGVTPLMRAAAALDYVGVPGTEMLLHQAVDQVRLMTGSTPSTEAMRDAMWRAGAALGLGAATLRR